MNSDVKLIAFYLPQFHPVPENDRWWGAGFTDWNNVVKARPAFAGHHQPQLPADLGFYDLRVAETREEQADLAREYGIFGFCYHYYWFNGKRLLERPLNDVVATGRPDFPFCVCWANENWTRRWDGHDDDILIAQEYSSDADTRLIDELIALMRDRRYIRVRERPLLLVYRVHQLPNAKATADIWRERCLEAGVGDPLLCAVQTPQTPTDTASFGFDAMVEFPPHLVLIESVSVPSLRGEFRGLIADYVGAAQNMLQRPFLAANRRTFRGVMPAWDNTARLGDNATIFVNTHPKNYERWLRTAIAQTRQAYSQEERLIFINAWNEWAEGCHLEPDQLYGRQYLEATRAALQI